MPTSSRRLSPASKIMHPVHCAAVAPCVCTAITCPCLPAFPGTEWRAVCISQFAGFSVRLRAVPAGSSLRDSGHSLHRMLGAPTHWWICRAGWLCPPWRGGCPAPRGTDIGSESRLVQNFRRLVSEFDDGALEQWLKGMEAGDVRELAAYAAGIRRDGAAIDAMLWMKWNNGQLEGQVNRIKRHMYGRANVELLRQRVLHAT